MDSLSKTSNISPSRKFLLSVVVSVQCHHFRQWKNVMERRSNCKRLDWPRKFTWNRFSKFQGNLNNIFCFCSCNISWEPDAEVLEKKKNLTRAAATFIQLSRKLFSTYNCGDARLTSPEVTYYSGTWLQHQVLLQAAVTFTSSVLKLCNLYSESND